MRHSITLFLFVGGTSKTKVERKLELARRAAARDLLRRIASSDRIERIVIATDEAEWTEELQPVGIPLHVEIDPRDRPFRFGERLSELTRRYRPDRLLVTGGGSAPLITEETWGHILKTLCSEDHLVITNNVHSSDWVGFTDPEQTAEHLKGLENDNGLAWVLTHDLHLPERSLPPTAATRFDLDTPVDLLIAHRHPDIGSNLKATIEELGWPTDLLTHVVMELKREGGHVTIAGRVSSTAWSSIEKATRCWIRVFSEERGMRASGRQQRGEVRSLLADHLEVREIEGFFEDLSRLTHTLLLDSRVILAARGEWPSRSDRFHSDLLQWERVQHPFLRDLTRGAAMAGFPVLLGGHSLVAGGLMTLAETLTEGKEKEE